VPRELVIVGTGITAITQVTSEAREAITRAEKVLYLLGEPFTAAYVERLNPTAESLLTLYRVGESRRSAYRRIVEHILECLTSRSVCVAFYGHPTAFVAPATEALRQARSLGYPARVIPGVSAEDCLFADLRIDPGLTGVQSYEATDFVIRPRNFDTSALLVLWQVGVFGDARYTPGGSNPPLDVLAEVLQPHYGAQHEVLVYTASCHPAFEARVDAYTLSSLCAARVTAAATLLVPPTAPPAVDRAMQARLGFCHRVR
jgi:precorrin-6B methylase 1